MEIIVQRVKQGENSTLAKLYKRLAVMMEKGEVFIVMRKAAVLSVQRSVT